ncbi:Periplasmic oligopeptide-binding protein oppA [Hartmannibacter diazotrophicus]|uniref:Periplasmic oligopeptide-binding protein oppA n=1 Tax=Hartmannibacter diazotrophicus TaxID=1482074 RepID=A0A2C9D0J5_9HYPH|nr:ABC transporter substrate-binding protein [Hartmannibacter diazotrophicus]SON53766.1 Periplasmic oligopeptide-binding protein oppA [Hartmannibacter diazotrophicus]
MLKLKSLRRTRAGLAVLAAALLAQTAIGSVAHAEDRAALMAEHRGGTMVLSAVAAAGTIDPMVNYTAEFWQIFQPVYDGLVKFKQASRAEGFVIVPDLAEAIPDATNDGKTYVFTLRKGIKFSNGKEVTPSDVVASFQRIFKINGPTSGSFYNGIVGADACLKEPASCTLEGGVIGDDAAGTVTINLTQPDSEFFAKIAVPHASILPGDTPIEDAGTKAIPGTGAYVIESYDPNEKMVLKRNPEFKEWSVDAQPDGYPDEIVYRFGLTEEAAINAIQNGQVDWLFDPPPADRLEELGTKYADQVHVNPLSAFWYAPMNTNLAPFDNVKVRQAVNYAVDRDALVGLYGGTVLAQPVCQILPPDFPGHEDSCIYTQDPGTEWSAPDMEKAKQLVEESGTKGQKVTVITEDNAVSRAVGTYLQSVLSELGYDASVKAISTNIQFTYIQNTDNKVQISVSQWFMDYPQASNFLNVLLSCASFTPGSDASINIAGYCNKDLDDKMHAAMKLSLTDPDAANAEWAKIDQAFMEQAPLAPLFTPKNVDFVSKRVGNFIFSNQFRWVISQSWVK